ncbi:hypothetical protein [Pelagibacterium halotolerans]|uniref:hypothetical protein n=1 Tax=Pelagibacterium halotolerans TaxID=531813 RepID=UPI00384A8687
MKKYIPTLQNHTKGGVFSLECIIDRIVMLDIHLIDSFKNKKCISFDSYISYRKIDEGDAMMILDEISKTSRIGCSFYIVDNSDYIDWIVNQSYGVRDPASMVHYLISTYDDIIEVVTVNPPLISG